MPRFGVTDEADEALIEKYLTRYNQKLSLSFFHSL
jgi:hypothetical protein